MWNLVKKQISQKQRTEGLLSGLSGGGGTVSEFSSVHFSRSVMSDSSQPHNRSTPGLPVHHKLPEFTQTHVHQFSDAIQPSHPLSSPSPPVPHHLTLTSFLWQLSATLRYTITLTIVTILYTRYLEFILLIIKGLDSDIRLYFLGL